MKMLVVYFPSMSKQVGIIIGIIAVIVIGGAAFAYMQFANKSTQPQESVSITQEKASQSASTQTRNSIKSLLGVGRNATCKISYPDGTTSGTIYVADNKIRGDFNLTTPDNKQMESHMIQDGQFSYFWTGTTGTKIKIDTSTTQTSPAAGQQQGTDFDKEVDMDCSSGSIDSSKFTLPADVKFTDLSQAIQTPASVCNAITDPQAKTACLKSAGQ